MNERAGLEGLGKSTRGARLGPVSADAPWSLAHRLRAPGKVGVLAHRESVLVMSVGGKSRIQSGCGRAYGTGADDAERVRDAD